MKKIKKFKIKTYLAKTGKLIPISFNKQFPIQVKRVFFLPYKKNILFTFIGNCLLKLMGMSFPVDFENDFNLNFLIFFI